MPCWKRNSAVYRTNSGTNRSGNLQTCFVQRIVHLCSLIQFGAAVITLLSAIACIHSICYGSFIAVGIWTGITYFLSALLCVISSRVSSEVLLIITASVAFLALLLTCLDGSMNTIGLITEVQLKKTFENADLHALVENDWWLQHRCDVAHRHILIHVTCIIVSQVNFLVSLIQVILLSRRFVRGKVPFLNLSDGDQGDSQSQNNGDGAVKGESIRLNILRKSDFSTVVKNPNAADDQHTSLLRSSHFDIS